MSGFGPSGVIFIGVWQSLHPATVTRYVPRAGCSPALAAARRRGRMKRRRPMQFSETFSGNSRLSPLASLIYWLGKLSIHRAISAMASVSTTVEPSGGICWVGSRERMRSATTLDAG